MLAISVLVLNYIGDIKYTNVKCHGMTEIYVHLPDICR